MKTRKKNLEKIIKSLENKVHEIVLEDREGQFLVDNFGHDIVLIMNNGETVVGELMDIDKSRLSLKSKNKVMHFYKQSIQAYYNKDEDLKIEE